MDQPKAVVVGNDLDVGVENGQVAPEGDLAVFPSSIGRVWDSVKRTARGPENGPVGRSPPRRAAETARRPRALRPDLSPRPTFTPRPAMGYPNEHTGAMRIKSGLHLEPPGYGFFFGAAGAPATTKTVAHLRHFSFLPMNFSGT
jgi:hypothetical protein